MNCKIWSDQAHQAHDVKLQLEQWSTQLYFSDFGELSKLDSLVNSEESVDVHFICCSENDVARLKMSFELFSLSSLFVFVLSEENQLIKSIESSGLDYLVWPITMYSAREIEGRLKDLRAMAAECHDFFPGYRNALHFMDSHFQQHNSNELILPCVRGYVVSRIEKIIRFETEGPYSAAIMEDSTIVLTNKPLRHFEAVLQELGFVRLNNDHLINLNYLDSFKRENGLSVVMRDGKMLEASMRWIPMVLEELSKFDKGLSDDL
jgi:DNA-binding LytR/AlgR family response regulator